MVNVSAAGRNGDGANAYNGILFYALFFYTRSAARRAAVHHCGGEPDAETGVASTYRPGGKRVTLIPVYYIDDFALSVFAAHHRYQHRNRRNGRAAFHRRRPLCCAGYRKCLAGN